jgi:hypothetical protein
MAWWFLSPSRSPSAGVYRRLSVGLDLARGEVLCDVYGSSTWAVLLVSVAKPAMIPIFVF